MGVRVYPTRLGQLALRRAMLNNQHPIKTKGGEEFYIDDLKLATWQFNTWSMIRCKQDVRLVYASGHEDWFKTRTNSIGFTDARITDEGRSQLKRLIKDPYEITIH